MSFSSDIANNLIEKHETSAAMANINAVLAAMDVEDELKPSRNGGSEEQVGFNGNISGGNTMR